MGPKTIDFPGVTRFKVEGGEYVTISAITENDLDSFKYDFDDDVTGPKVKKLKIGDSYDADGGINIYIRIKK